MRFLLVRCFFILSLFSGLVHAEVQDFDRGVFWEVRSPEGRLSYVLGSLHLSGEVTKQVEQAMLPYIDNADSVLIEHILTDSLQQKIQELYFLPEGSVLSDFLSEETYQALLAWLAEYGIPEAQVARFSPFGANVLVGIPSVFLSSDMPMDWWLADYAAEKGKKVVALEDGVQALESAHRVYKDYLIQGIEGSLKILDELRLAPEMEQAHYLKEDIVEYAMQEMKKNKEIYGVDDAFYDLFWDELLVKRNDCFIKSAAPFLEQGGAFIIMGALHLPREEGVLYQLEQQGYHIQRAQPIEDLIAQLPAAA